MRRRAAPSTEPQSANSQLRFPPRVVAAAEKRQKECPRSGTVCLAAHGETATVCEAAGANQTAPQLPNNHTGTMKSNFFCDDNGPSTTLIEFTVKFSLFIDYMYPFCKEMPPCIIKFGNFNYIQLI